MISTGRNLDTYFTFCAIGIVVHWRRTVFSTLNVSFEIEFNSRAIITDFERGKRNVWTSSIVECATAIIPLLHKASWKVHVGKRW
jgi:hypothetical protein